MSIVKFIEDNWAAIVTIANSIIALVHLWGHPKAPGP